MFSPRFTKISEFVSVIWTKVTDTNKGGWLAERQIQIATLPSLIILCTLPVLYRTLQQYFLELWQRRGLTFRRLLHAWSNWMLYTPALWPACVEPGACDVHPERFNTSVVYLMLNTNNFLHVNTIFTQYTTNTIFICDTINITTRANVQQVTEADWLTRARDKTQSPSFVSHIVPAWRRDRFHKLFNWSRNCFWGFSTKM
jgi:hypothetical protein